MQVIADICHWQAEGRQKKLREAQNYTDNNDNNNDNNSTGNFYGVVPKGLLTFLGFFVCLFLLCNAEFSPCWALPEYIRALIH